MIKGQQNLIIISSGQGTVKIFQCTFYTVETVSLFMIIATTYSWSYSEAV